MIAVVWMVGRPVNAQQTTGTITGRVVDEQKSTVPGATVTARSVTTGFMRVSTSDASGMYRLAALPVGTYDLTVELSGFATIDRKGLVVNVSQTVTLEFELRVAKMTETVTVTGETPLIETTSSSVGGVVDVNKIENLPLNGRQFANLAMTVAGVGMGFHSDPTKSTQYSPQVAGGNGRNVNYQIDGGDNNDDTVGGLLQQFPLEAIQEFNMITQRYKAEYGRSNGGVMNIVTKGGTNHYQGSWFTMLRDKSMNAQTETERLTETDKPDYRRYQFGGSFGGPVVQNKAHFFAAFERTQQDTNQAVDTGGLFPSMNGVYGTPYRENLFTAKATANVTANQFLSVRYGRNDNSQPYGAGPQLPPSNWGDSKNSFNSVNLNYNWVLGGSKLNEFIFQVANFKNNVTANSTDPQQCFPNGVCIGANGNTPQTTEQIKWQFRDDFSWHKMGGMGLGHDFKMGLNVIYEPRLYITFNSGISAYSYTHLTNDVNGPISSVSRSGGDSSADIPNKQIGLYFQDDWRINDRFTVNLGLRYDVVLGWAIDQSKAHDFQVLQAAGRSGRLNGMSLFEDFGKSSQEDYKDFQPRVGFAWDVKGNGRDVVRAGWGMYYDFSYSNASLMFAAIDARGVFGGTVFSVSQPDGILKANGTNFTVNDPISTIASQNEIDATVMPANGHIMSPRFKQPYTHQVSAGWSHALSSTTVLDIDYVGVFGRHLGWRPRLNTRVNGGARRLSDLDFSYPNFAIDISAGKSTYHGLTMGIRRRMDKHVQVNAWYSLSTAQGTGGNGTDELTVSNIQDASQPLAARQYGPSGRTDARHKITVSAVIEAPGGINISPIFRYRSALPVNIVTGFDNNRDGARNDIASEAFAFNGLDASGNPIVESLGSCATINCGRGASMSVFNLRVSKVFKLPRNIHFEAIGEVFNLFNAKNPSDFVGQRFIGTLANPTPNPDFMRPLSFAGDFQMPEQRVGQIGFRLTF
jgi:hypothetical protein